MGKLITESAFRWASVSFLMETSNATGVDDFLWFEIT